MAHLYLKKKKKKERKSGTAASSRQIQSLGLLTTPMTAYSFPSYKLEPAIKKQSSHGRSSWSYIRQCVENGNTRQNKVCRELGSVVAYRAHFLLPLANNVRSSVGITQMPTHWRYGTSVHISGVLTLCTPYFLPTKLFLHNSSLIQQSSYIYVPQGKAVQLKAGTGGRITLLKLTQVLFGKTK